MPIFEYQCRACDNVFEILTLSRQSVTKIQCDKCGSDQVEKIISASNIRSTSGMSLPAAPPVAGGCGGGSGFS